MKQPLVIYIIGDDRSGSTLLDYLISASSQAHSVGELHHLNEYFNLRGIGIERNWECSCGSQVKRCAFWKVILNKVGFSASYKTKAYILEPRWAFLMPRKYYQVINKSVELDVNRENGRIVAENCWKIYQAVSMETGKTFIVDSSKMGEEAFFLNAYKKGAIKFLLLERDLREVAFSKSIRAMDPHPTNIQKRKSIYRYLLGCYKIRLRNRLFAKIIQENSNEDIVKIVDYSGLSMNPQKVIDEVSSFLGMDKFVIPTCTNQYKETPHIISGSPSRYDKKPIKPDQRWESFYRKNLLASIAGKFLQSL